MIVKNIQQSILDYKNFYHSAKCLFPEDRVGDNQCVLELCFINILNYMG